MSTILFVVLLAASGLAVDLTLVALYGQENLAIWHIAVILLGYAALHIGLELAGNLSHSMAETYTTDPYATSTGGGWMTAATTLLLLLLLMGSGLTVAYMMAMMWLSHFYGPTVSWWHPLALFGVYMVAGTAFNTWAGRLKS